jgi:hypothetical protein
VNGHPFLPVAHGKHLLEIYFTAPTESQTYLNCGEFDAEAREASVDKPGSCGREVEWCNEECVVEVEDGLEIGSTMGIECLPSSF